MVKDHQFYTPLKESLRKKETMHSYLALITRNIFWETYHLYEDNNPVDHLPNIPGETLRQSKLRMLGAIKILDLSIHASFIPMDLVMWYAHFVGRANLDATLEHERFDIPLEEVFLNSPCDEVFIIPNFPMICLNEDVNQYKQIMKTLMYRRMMVKYVVRHGAPEFFRRLMTEDSVSLYQTYDIIREDAALAWMFGARFGSDKTIKASYLEYVVSC